MGMATSPLVDRGLACGRWPPACGWWLSEPRMLVLRSPDAGGQAPRCLLDEDGDRCVRTGVGHVAGHLGHGDRVAGDQADQSAPGPVRRLGVEGQRLLIGRAELELPE